jgi:hypothetical protein
MSVFDRVSCMACEAAVKIIKSGSFNEILSVVYEKSLEGAARLRRRGLSEGKKIYPPRASLKLNHQESES